MRISHLLLCVLVAGAVALDAAPQRRSVGQATFAVFVADPAGKPLTGVRVILEGPTPRQATTERGRIALEDLAQGKYTMRFVRDGYVTQEREVVAKGTAPIDVKVTLEPVLVPVPKIETLPAPPPPPPARIEPVTIDLAAFVEKNYVGRAAGKASPIACSAGGNATLLQLRDPLTEHAHADADEFLYVIAGAGAAQIGGREQPLQASVFTLIPRGVPHTLTMKGKNPLIVLSIKAGEACKG